MATLSRLNKIALLGLGAVGGGLTYYKLGMPRNHDVHNSWPINYIPSVKWNKNWDNRDPESVSRPKRFETIEDGKEDNEKAQERTKPKAVRHMILIRHGQYNTSGANDKERVLTELGRKQAELTGQRLAKLNIKWDLIVRSTMTRAQQTAAIIAKHQGDNVEMKDCQMLEEGAPVPPEPPVGHWKPEPKDSARIEAAFRRYFYRAPPDQNHETFTLLVCHANVIRFFVCKALQFPVEGWLRISLCHGSITWLSIMPNGNVVLRSLSETGHMDPQCITSR